jgi:outer membrane protein assembly factor BamB
MPLLEIRRRSGAIESLELSKDAPLLVGELASNDIQVEADGVAPIHCRISWNRNRYEVAAVSPDGVQYNGKMVRSSPLTAGDVLRVGDVDIVLMAQVSAEPARAAPAVGGRQSREDALFAALTADDLPVPVRSFDYGKLPDEPPAAERVSTREDRAEAGVGMSRVAFDGLELATDGRPGETKPGVDPRQAAEAAERIRESLKLSGRRPGEQDPLRSPLVIGLSVGAFLLLIASASIWFLLNRERAQKQFDLAESQLRSGQFNEAIAGFEQFLQQHPSHKLAPEARAEIGTARVEQAIAGATPAWDKGLEVLQKYIETVRTSPQFQDPSSPLRRFVLESTDRIAAGAIEAARTQRKREPLAISEEAIKLLRLYSPSPPVERLQELATATHAAERVVHRQELFDAATVVMDGALEARTPAGMFREYRRVLAVHPVEGKEYRPFRERLKKSFELERSLTKRDEQVREAAASSAAAEPLRRLTLARRTRVRSDQASVGVAVHVMAEDCLYGVDNVTGEPLWRQVVGLDPPFAPIPILAGQPALLVASTRQHELWLLAARTGEFLWRLPLAALPAGPPVVHEGQIYLATQDRTLEQIDLQTGRTSARLAFTQAIAAPAAVSQSGERLYLPGHENVLYVLTRRPLACEQVVWMGHGPGAIQAPALMLRTYLLLADNFNQAQSQLRLFDTTREDQPPVEIAQQKIDGQVRDAPALRGKSLFVPSSPERIWAFTVAETGDQKSLNAVATYQTKNSAGPPLFLWAGPDDQTWMFSSSLRRFNLGPDSLLPDKLEVAQGIASQPMQATGDSLFVARRLAYSRAVLLAEVDRRQAILQWQLSLGGGCAGASSPSAKEGTVLFVNTLGDLFQVTSSRLTRGGYDLQPVGQLPIPEGLTEPIVATRLDDGRLTAYCGGAEPRLWQPGGDGQARELKLSDPLEAPPVRLAGGLLLPLPGRLRLAARPGNDPAVQDLPSPINQEAPPRWINAVALNGTQAVVLTETGRLARIQFGTAPVPHIEEITHWEAGHPVDVPCALDGGRLFLADDSPRIVMLDATTLEPQATHALESPAAGPPRPAGTLVLVELKSGTLAALDTVARLEGRWTFDLEGAWLAGEPLVDGEQLILALTQGRIVWLDSKTGTVAKSVDVGQQLAFGPQRWGTNLVVGTLDGSLVICDRTGSDQPGIEQPQEAPVQPVVPSPEKAPHEQ